MMIFILLNTLMIIAIGDKSAVFNHDWKQHYSSSFVGNPLDIIIRPQKDMTMYYQKTFFHENIFADHHETDKNALRAVWKNIIHSLYLHLKNKSGSREYNPFFHTHKYLRHSWLHFSCPWRVRIRTTIFCYTGGSLGYIIISIIIRQTIRTEKIPELKSSSNRRPYITDHASSSSSFSSFDNVKIFLQWKSWSTTNDHSWQSMIQHSTTGLQFHLPF